VLLPCCCVLRQWIWGNHSCELTALLALHVHPQFPPCIPVWVKEQAVVWFIDSVCFVFSPQNTEEACWLTGAQYPCSAHCGNSWVRLSGMMSNWGVTVGSKWVHEVQELSVTLSRDYWHAFHSVSHTVELFKVYSFGCRHFRCMHTI